MNSDILEGKWKQISGKVRDMWGKLTDDDVEHVDGKRERLSGRIQERYGYGKDRVEREIDEWINKV